MSLAFAWHAAPVRPREQQRRCEETGPDLGCYSGAGDGNRTRMASLEGCDCHVAVQLKPRSARTPMARE